MASSLTIELYHDQQLGWVPVGRISTGDPPGSISDNRPDGSRDLYQFGIDIEADQGYIKRSEAGLDTESPDHDSRAISSLGYIVIAALQHGESHELIVQTDRSPKPRRLRFTYL